MKVKYSEYEHFGVSTDEGVTFKKAKGELIGSGNKLVLRCSIAEEITAVNIYKSEDSVILFNQVTQMHVFFFFLSNRRIENVFIYFSLLDLLSDSYVYM